LFDLLVFPLLILDGLILWLVYLLMCQSLVWVGLPPGTEISLESTLLPTALVVIIVNVWLVRWAWLSAKRVPGKPQEVSDLESAAAWRRIAVPVSALLLLAATVILVANPLSARRKSETLSMSPPPMMQLDAARPQGQQPQPDPQVARVLAAEPEPFLTFRLVATNLSEGPVDALTDPNAPDGERSLLVLRQVLLDETAILRAALRSSATEDSQQIVITLSEEAAPRFREITRTNLGRQLAIVFQGRVLSAPTIQAEMGSQLVIAGGMNGPDAQAIVDELNRTHRITAAMATLQATPPVVVHTEPVSGASAVAPSLRRLQVTFSKPMKDGAWAWVQLDAETFPEVTGEPSFSRDGRTCVVPVRLQPGRTYATWINADDSDDFQDRDGTPAVPYLLVFQTRR
jgi:RNA polymerase sigma-70 factor (ECF subfamily)